MDDLEAIFEATKGYLVYLTAWLAICAYSWSTARLAWERLPTTRPQFLYAIGFVFFFVHVMSAFDVHYQWSHAEAVKETGLKTMAKTGYRVGEGIWANYLFGLVWLIDLVVWFVRGDFRYRRGHKTLVALRHGFFLLMIFFGAFYFVDGWTAWIGLAIFAFTTYAVIQLNYRKPPEPVESPA